MIKESDMILFTHFRSQKLRSCFLKSIKLLQFFLLIVFFGQYSFSQQGKVDTYFNTYDDGLLGDGFDNTVRTLSIQTDGKLIVGGEFLNFNGTVDSYLSRLNSDGTKDVSFNLGTGMNGKVYTSIIQADGKIILGGSFTNYNGSNVGRLIRLNADGTIDNSFNTTVGVNVNTVYDMALQADGKIIIVGSFSKYNGVVANKVARILPNGNIDATFITGLGATATIEEVQLQNDGKIILAGSFDSFNGFLTASKIVRLNTDGSVDANFVTGTGFNATITALLVQDDGKILVGGAFTTYNGLAINRLTRLNPDGTVDLGFVSGLGFSNGSVSVIKTNSLGLIWVGGSFSGTYNGTNVNRLVLLESNGTVNPIFDIGAGPATATVYALAVDSDSFWYVGGSFTVFDAQNQGRLAKIDAVGTLDIGYLTAGVGFDNSVLKVLPVSDKKIMVLGSFTKFNGIASSRIARLSENGLLDATFNSSGIGADGIIKTAILQPDNKIVLVGGFTNYNGIATNRIARIIADGTIDPSFNVGSGFNNQIYAVALQQDGKLLIGGNFTSFNGILVNRLVRLLSDGTLDSSFNVGLGADAIVETLLLQSDGKIVVGGRFTSFNGSTYNRLVRLNSDGSIDAGFTVGIGFDKYVYSIAQQSDAKLILGGTFLSYNGTTAKRLIRLNNDGSFDATFTIGTGFSNGEIRNILVQPDDRLLIGGSFSGTYNGISVKRMLRLNASGVYDISFSVNLNGTLFSSCFTPNNDVIIGGNFNSVSGIAKHRIAQLKLCTNSSNWNGIIWSNGAPSDEKELIFHDDYSLLSSANSCSCTIDLGKKVVISGGKTLGLRFNYSGSGIMVLEDTAALYQADDAMINTGMIQLKRKTTAVTKSDYTYWSAPVYSQQLSILSPDSAPDGFYSFNALSDSWTSELGIAKMNVGLGYIIRAPENFSEISPAIFEASFLGIPNNGVVTVPIAAADTSNLIGNPYPSAINADLFLTANAGILDGTLYFWTHNTPINQGVYTSNDYAEYNLLGGVGTSPATSLGVNVNKPNGTIVSGQAFFVTGINQGGIATFNNSMRILGQNGLFFKANPIKKLKNSNTIEKHRIWLNLSNKEGAFKQTLIGYATGATNEYESIFDGTSFEGNDYLDFYSINQGMNLAIQGRALPFTASDEVPLGYKTEIEGTFQINIDETDGILSNQTIYIEDRVKNLIQNISQGSYTFFTEKGTFNNRFVLKFKDKNLETTNFNQEQNRVFIESKNKQLKISAPNELIDKIVIYDLLGRERYKNSKVNENEFIFYDLGMSTNIILVQVTLNNGEITTRKIKY
jgi:uncharacterized delta-60 repeat protein